MFTVLLKNGVRASEAASNKSYLCFAAQRKNRRNKKKQYNQKPKIQTFVFSARKVFRN